MRDVVVRARSLICLAVMTLLAGCTLGPAGADGDAGSRLRARLPQTWSADISCPGCTGHSMTLTLFGDGSFRQRDRYAGSPGSGDEIFHDIGLWRLELDDDPRLILRGGTRLPRQLRLRDEGSLQLLDDEGRDIRSIREYVLARQPQVDLFSAPMRLLGLYQPDDEGAWFSECLTGQRWRLQPSPRSAELATQFNELAAARAGTRPARLLAVRGRPELPQAGGRVQHLDVDAVERFWPDSLCRRDLISPAQPLLETSWVLIELHGSGVRTGSISEPPLLRLRQDGRLTGTTGCNRMQAAYQRDGNRLSVPRPMITRMTCPAALQQQEQALLAALRATRDYRVVGNVLELRDGDAVLARLVVSEMP